MADIARLLILWAQDQTRAVFGLYSRHNCSLWCFETQCDKRSKDRNLLHVRVSAFIIKAGMPCKTRMDTKPTVQVELESSSKKQKTFYCNNLISNDYFLLY